MLLSESTKRTESLIVFGAGGHGRVVADAALLGGRWADIAATDGNTAACRGELLPGIPLIEEKAARKLTAVIHIAIGNNIARQKIAASWDDQRLASVVHPSAAVSRFSAIGSGCFVAAGAIVGPAADVGRGVIVNHGAVVEHDVAIAAFSHISENATLGGHVRVGQRVLIGPGVVVLPSLRIGDDVIVNPGSVVSGHLLEPGIYGGNPARKIQ
jgi:sugar O-acyltransferase (sialic acid O-acetyltransferase NeuD family)